jgi:hypothetical protein
MSFNGDGSLSVVRSDVFERRLGMGRLWLQYMYVALCITIGRFSSVNGSKCKTWGAQLANALKQKCQFGDGTRIRMSFPCILPSRRDMWLLSALSLEWLDKAKNNILKTTQNNN